MASVRSLPAPSSFAGSTGESIFAQRANGTMDPPVKPEGDAVGRLSRSPDGAPHRYKNRPTTSL